MSNITVKHKFVSPKSEQTDPTLVGPVEWNDFHVASDSNPIIVSEDFSFTPQSPGGSLVIGANTITLTPVPKGVNGSDQNHYLYVSGGTGTAEKVLITGGTAVSGSASGTVIITCTSNHTGAWTIQSSSDGIQEAIISLGPVTSSFLAGGTGGGLILIPVGMHDIYAPITLTSNVTLYGLNVHSTTLRSNNSSTIIRTLGSALTGCIGCGIENVHFDLNLQPNIIGLDLYGCCSGVFRNLFFDRGNSQTGKAIYMHGSPKVGGTYGPDYCVDCLFDHIHIEIGPSTCLALMRTTLCTFRHMRFACDTGPIIDLIEATDTNYFYDINLGSGNAGQGIYCNSSGTVPDGNFGVGSFHFFNVIVEGACPGAGIVINNAQSINIVNYGGTWTVPFIFTIGSTGCTIRNIFGFGLAQNISEWAYDGYIIGTSANPSFLAFGRYGPTVTNGINNNIVTANAGLVVVSGPTTAFSISGFTGGIPGRILYLYNATTQQMTLLNQNVGSTAANQINTLTGANLVLRTGRSFTQLMYDDIIQQWVVMSSN